MESGYRDDRPPQNMRIDGDQGPPDGDDDGGNRGAPFYVAAPPPPREQRPREPQNQIGQRVFNINIKPREPPTFDGEPNTNMAVWAA